MLGILDALQSVELGVDPFGKVCIMITADSTDEFLQHVFPGSSIAMKSFRREIEQLNQYCRHYKGAIRCILLTGETGVGKTFAARAISAHSQWLTLTEDEKRELFHDAGGKLRFPAARLVEMLLVKEHLPGRGAKSKRVRRLATVLAPQLSDELAASELFGHKRHAFSGAEEAHPGVFGDEAVDDILLDEIADLSPRVQAKLLQFIETGTFRPVGGLAQDERTSQHRILLATNRVLPELVRKGDFRDDLYYRIQGHQIHIPPLRDRMEVMGDLTYSILHSVNYSHRGEQEVRPAFQEELQENKYSLLPQHDWEGGKPTVSNWVLTLTDEDLQWCMEYDWPGNVRELKHRLEQYVYHNGHRRLRDTMQPNQLAQLRATSAFEDDCRDERKIVDSLIADRLQRILEGREHPIGRPGELVDLFAQLVKGSIYRFKAQKGLGKKELAEIFPDAKDAETTIGRWKPLKDAQASPAQPHVD